MSHFAKVENGVVTQIIVAEQDFINSGAVGQPSDWIQTSYNTRGNVHYGRDGKPDGDVALRGNYAGIGSIYDTEHDVFYGHSPFPSWILNHSTWTWEAPVPYPVDRGTQEDPKGYIWNEETQAWDLHVPPTTPTE